MQALWTELERVERETLATAVDDATTLAACMERRGALIQALCRAIEKETCGVLSEADRAAAYDRLLVHHAAGASLADRLRQGRARVVEAWGESTRERQLLHLLEATQGLPVRDGARGLVELG